MIMPDRSARPIRILIAALGGQGGGVLAEWLVAAATRAGLLAQGTSIPGVAQRTGATTYYVEVYPVPVAELRGRRPVLSLYPVPGRVDLVVASELLEAARVLQAGVASADRTHLITSTSRTLTTAEKLALGDGRFASERLLAAAGAHCRRLTAFDMDAAARDAGTVVSAVMLGAVAGCGLLPIAPSVFEAVVRESGVGVAGSLRGLAAGMGACDGAIASATPRPASAPAATAEWPAEVAAIAALGEARVREFQDPAYAALYRDRVTRVLAAERTADPQMRQGLVATREFARYLALWMAFDDIVRVAGLKVRASRFERVRREVNAEPGDIVRIIDHFKPGVPEFAGLLPASLARRLLAWDRRRQARGRRPFAWPLHLRADGALGLLMLRTLAALRGWRRHGLRYQEEQAAIERWQDAVVEGLRKDWDLGHEIALCGRLIKGYGDTNERGKRNLSHIIAHLAGGDGPPALRASAIREAREAALTDEGKALDVALVRHGAPPRPVVPQPMRFVRDAGRKAAATTSTV